jgi:hypothetical protein
MAANISLDSLKRQIDGISLYTAIPVAVITIIVLVLSTRFLTGRPSNSINGKSGVRPPRIPYWVPILRNLPAYISGPIEFLENAIQLCPQGIYTIFVGSSAKTVVYSPTLLQQLKDNQSDSIDPLLSQIRMLQHGWGLPSGYTKETENVLPQVLEKLQNIFETQGQEILDSGIKLLEKKLPTLVTFMDTTVDQEDWERISLTGLLEDGVTAETSLLYVMNFRPWV